MIRLGVDSLNAAIIEAIVTFGVVRDRVFALLADRHRHFYLVNRSFPDLVRRSRYRCPPKSIMTEGRPQASSSKSTIFSGRSMLLVGGAALFSFGFGVEFWSGDSFDLACTLRLPAQKASY